MLAAEPARANLTGTTQEQRGQSRVDGHPSTAVRARAGLEAVPNTCAGDWAWVRGILRTVHTFQAGKGKSPAACHEGISGTGDVWPTIRSAAVAINPSVEKALSTKRLDAYRQHASTEDGAWALYRWNTEISSAVLPMAADLEVTLRNTIHELMADRFGREDWWASPTLLFDDVTNQMLTDVVRKHQKKLASGTVGPGRVTADTTLGVWVHLLSRGGHSALGRSVDYEARLWRPTLRFGFSAGTRTPSGRERRPARSEVHRRTLMFQRLRNRAVHHETALQGCHRSRNKQTHAAQCGVGTEHRIAPVDVPRPGRAAPRS